MTYQDEKWYIRCSPRIGEKFQEFHDILKEKTALDKKTKELLMASIASVLRCRYCTETHIKGALEVGASKEEVAEALLIAALEGAGTQLHWAQDIYEKHL